MLKHIGIFDSGIGGLWLLLELQKKMPSCEFSYFADSGYAPWGALSKARVLERSEAITDFLIVKGCESIVVACNTATSLCIEHLRSKYSQRFFGIEPAIKPAGLVTKTGSIGLLATYGTLSSERVHVLISKYSEGAVVECLNFPGVVELIEGGKSISREDISSTIDDILDQFKKKNIDTIILGCTHYRYFYEEIMQKAGNEFYVLEPVCDVVKHIAKKLSYFDIENVGMPTSDSTRIYTSSIDTTAINKSLELMFANTCAQVEYVANV
ncbi:MAG: glutamate racemase [Gammaproteobacteria bacterium]|nr:glutamate racemase [Gammaproteobacteria bacterium]